MLCHSSLVQSLVWLLLQFFYQAILPVDLEEDVAFAAFSGEDLIFLSTSTASPGGPNLLDLEVGFSHEAGFYGDVIELLLNFDEPALGDVEIRYTLTGDEPGSTDALFTSSVLVDNRSTEENLLTNIPCTPNFVDRDGENYYPAWTPLQEKVGKGRGIRAAASLAG